MDSYLSWLCGFDLAIMAIQSAHWRKVITAMWRNLSILVDSSILSLHIISLYNNCDVRQIELQIQIQGQIQIQIHLGRPIHPFFALHILPQPIPQQQCKAYANTNTNTDTFESTSTFYVCSSYPLSQPLQCQSSQIHRNQYCFL